MPCPIERQGDAWDVRGHDQVKAVALDDETFSSAVSRYLQVPNGMDGEEHDTYRRLTDRYLTTDRVNALIETMTDIAEHVVADAIDRGTTVDAVGLGAQFAVRASSKWLGWPTHLEAELLDWVRANWDATRSGKYARTSAVAAWYNSIITTLISQRRKKPTADVTSELIVDEYLGRRLTDEEITSILRNWTGGDLGSMALCIGVILVFLTDHPDLQNRLRAGLLTTDGEPGHVSISEWHGILDEILRLDDPFVANRRVATSDVELNGHTIEAGNRLYLNWSAANLDERVFGGFDPERHAASNLVWGIGRHVCPGRELATVQLRIFTQAVLARTTSITPGVEPRTRSLPPAGGYIEVPVVFHTP